MENDMTNNVADNNEGVATPQEQQREFTDTTNSPDVAANNVETETQRVSKRINTIRAEYDKKLAEAQGQISSYEKLAESLRKNGYEGNSPDELVYSLMAQAEGMTVDEVRAREENRLQQQNDLINSSPIVKQAEEIIAARQLESDLAAIKKVHPEVNVESPFDLGDRYIELMATGQMDALTAYEVMRAEETRGKKEVPKSMGSVGIGDLGEKDFYTSEEVDKLPASAYENPSIMKKIRESMLKW